MSEEKKEEKKAAPKKAAAKKESPKSNEELVMLGQEVEVAGEKFLVKQIKGIDLIISRKDYK